MLVIMPLYMVYTKLCMYLVLSRNKFFRGKMQRIVTVNYQYWRGGRENLLQTIFLIYDCPSLEEIIQQNIVLRIQSAFLLLLSGAKLFVRICVRHHVTANRLQPEIKKKHPVTNNGCHWLKENSPADNGYRQWKNNSLTWM